MRTTEDWRERLDFLTVASAVTFLRNLGPYHRYRFNVCCSEGYKRLNAKALAANFNPQAPAVKIGPVYFRGGPTRVEAYKGTYLTFLIDCAMAAQMGRSAKHVDDVVAYTRAVCTAALPKPILFYDKICRLIRELHNTRTPIEHGIENIGLIYTDYDICDVEEKILEAGMGQCDSCGLWVQAEHMDSECETCILQKAIA